MGRNVLYLQAVKPRPPGLRQRAFLSEDRAIIFFTRLHAGPHWPGCILRGDSMPASRFTLWPGPHLRHRCRITAMSCGTTPCLDRRYLAHVPYLSMLAVLLQYRFCSGLPNGNHCGADMTRHERFCSCFPNDPASTTPRASQEQASGSRSFRQAPSRPWHAALDTVQEEAIPRCSAGCH